VGKTVVTSVGLPAGLRKLRCSIKAARGFESLPSACCPGLEFPLIDFAWRWPADRVYTPFRRRPVFAGNTTRAEEAPRRASRRPTIRRSLRCSVASAQDIPRVRASVAYRTMQRTEVTVPGTLELLEAAPATQQQVLKPPARHPTPSLQTPRLQPPIAILGRRSRFLDLQVPRPKRSTTPARALLRPDDLLQGRIADVRRPVETGACDAAQRMERGSPQPRRSLRPYRRPLETSSA